MEVGIPSPTYLAYQTASTSRADPTEPVEPEAMDWESPFVQQLLKKLTLKTVETDIEQAFDPFRELSALKRPEANTEPEVPAPTPGTSAPEKEETPQGHIVIERDDMDVTATTTFITRSHEQSTSKTFKDSLQQKAENAPDAKGNVSLEDTPLQASETDPGKEPESSGNEDGVSGPNGPAQSRPSSPEEDFGSGAEALRQAAGSRLVTYAVSQASAAPSDEGAPRQQTESSGIDTVA